MVYIKLEQASVDFIIYNIKTRSIRHNIYKAIGGKIRQVDNNIYIKALDNISFEFKEGARVGLIGHNGAGKSTLLKLISGVYEPSAGNISVCGKVSSLTDITMGMDSDNSGYENIIMRLVFMGLTFKEAKSKVAEIIEFSELEDHINLPMRTYSSGMYMRLAFTIATSIIHDILIMDEMIGTGDASFIKKAKERFQNMLDKTKIIVISSHDLNILSETCNYGIWMEKGKIKAQGLMKDVIDEYSKSLN